VAQDSFLGAMGTTPGADRAKVRSSDSARGGITRRYRVQGKFAWLHGMSGTSVGFGAVTDAAGAPPRAGVIGDNAYDRLRETDRAKYSRVSAGPNGGSEAAARDRGT
jgi:hypothetical protein